jgi:hypothetical protein
MFEFYLLSLFLWLLLNIIFQRFLMIIVIFLNLLLLLLWLIMIFLFQRLSLNILDETGLLMFFLLVFLLVYLLCLCDFLMFDLLSLIVLVRKDQFPFAHQQLSITYYISFILTFNLENTKI